MSQLGAWMHDVVAQHALARAALDVDPVHDLRVALRRCRTMAQALRDLDDADGRRQWRLLNALARPVFQGLGDLRDAQVMAGWARALLPGHDDGAAWGAVLDARADALLPAAQQALDAFDVEAWQALSKTLPPRVDVLLAERPLLLGSALRRAHDAHALHRAAMPKAGGPADDGVALHDLRIGVKRLRYTLENLLPDVLERLGKTVKKTQDALGEIHDFDVLRAVVEAAHAPPAAVAAPDRPPEAAAETGPSERPAAAPIASTTLPTTLPTAALLAALATARAERLQAYRALALGPTGFWAELRRALPRGNAALRCHRALLWRSVVVQERAERVARARRTERAALDLWRALRPGGRGLARERLRLLLAMAALSSGSKPKRARALLARAPLGWGFDDATRRAVSAVAAGSTAADPQLQQLAAVLGAARVAARSSPLQPHAVPPGVRLRSPAPVDARRFAHRRVEVEAAFGCVVWSESPAPPEPTQAETETETSG